MHKCSHYEVWFVYTQVVIMKYDLYIHMSNYHGNLALNLPY